MALDATVGGASANSFGSLAEADAYFEDRPQYSDWEALEEYKEPWLIAATDRLAQEFYQGRRTDDDQALPFPRVGVVVDGIPFDSNVIPARIKIAQFKLAFLLSSLSDPLSDTGLEGFERIKVDVIELVPRATVPAGGLPEEIQREIGPFLGGASTYQFRIARG